MLFIEMDYRGQMSQNPSRPVVIAGNWKMYKTIEEAVGYVETLSPLVKKSQARVYLAVPYTAIYPTVQRLKELKASIVIGAQNMNDASEGAFTGEIAAQMLIEAGAKFVIVGHSERRHLFNESNSFINRKVKQALACKIQPILCIGETLEQRESGATQQVLKEQLLQSLKGVTARDLPKMIVAYEPVWAIGTGKIAEPHDAQMAHHFCRTTVQEKWGEKAASHLVIQYGGSVKPENAAELLLQEDIDGLLVGGASLSPHSFSEIINVYQGITL
jgi:triosephosphate isomerase (TIM)